MIRSSARLALLVVLVVFAPTVADEPSPAPQILQELKPRSIGPANMSGRVTDVAVFDKAPRIMYVATASGGLWKTINNGTTWKPVFDRQSTATLGAVAVDQQNPDIVWAGTGEANARNSVSWGDGVYLSTDGGKTWTNKGLKETLHVGRILIHPTDSNIVYVAALGKLWAANPERGVFKTTDAGKSWSKVLYFDDDTGAVDLAMDPGDPDRLYAALYQVRRGAFSVGNPDVQTGPHAGLYQTSDAGKTWSKLAKGLPARPLGRCGISVSASDPAVVYAVVQTDKTEVSVQGQGANEKLDASHGGIFRSTDHGATWTHLNSLVPRPFYYGQIRVDPSDAKRIYVLGINFHISKDAGKTFNTNNAAKNTHSDYHALWINPKDSHHLVLGSDGGLHFSYDRSATWEYLKNLPVSQFYAIGLDQRTPYRVYGGLQDNGSWYGMSANRNELGLTVADWIKILGYDGYYCQIDPDDPDTVYAEGQYGILRRINLRNWEKVDIRPRLKSKDYGSNIRPLPADGTPEYRFNWSSPIHLSPHNAKTVYFGGNVLFRSEDRGDTWAIISPDLTRGKPGPSANRGHTITTVAESPLKRGLIYVGTDDGNVLITSDHGQSWRHLTERFGEVSRDRTVSRVECSRAVAGVVYVAFDRHRNDDLAPYLFRSSDYGTTWKSVADNLPAAGPVYVVREDPRNPSLLYVGTEFGLFVSLDAGESWHKQTHLPTAPVHDLAIHPRERELVIATHGRGIYIMDALPLQELAGRGTEQDLLLCEVKPAQAFRRVPLTSFDIKNYVGANPPYGAVFSIFLREAPTAPWGVTVTDAQGKKVAQFKGSQKAGLQRLVWDLNREGTEADDYDPVPSGNYTATLRSGDGAVRRIFRVETEE